MIFGLGGGGATYITGGKINRIYTIGNAIGKVKVDEISRVKDVSIKSLPCPKVNDKGLTGAWWWADKIAIATAVWATNETWKSAKEEYKIGKRYYDLANAQWKHFYDFYRPLEDQELDEIWAELPHEPDYSIAIKGHTSLIDPIFFSADKHRMALMEKYCVCSDAGEARKTEFVKSTVRGDSANFASRYAEKLAQEKNDIRWARRISAASRGRGLLSASTSFASKASGFFSDYSQAVGGLASSAVAFSGYIRNRNQTQYNPVINSIDGRADVPSQYRGSDTHGYWQRRGIPETIGGESTSNVLQGYVSPDSTYSPSGFDPTGVVSSQFTN